MIPSKDQLATWTVNEVIRQFPGTVVLFKRYGIDACCGGALAVRAAALRHGADAGAMLAELQELIAGTNAQTADTLACQCQVP